MKARVAISNYHNGQICYPTVDAEWQGRGHVIVRLVWIDQSEPRSSPKREYGQAGFTGTVKAAEAWLIEQGVKLDAQGIH